MKSFLVLFFLIVASCSFSQTKKPVKMYKPQPPINKYIGDTLMVPPYTKFCIMDTITGKKEFYQYGDTILLYKNSIVGIRMLKD